MKGLLKKTYDCINKCIDKLYQCNYVLLIIIIIALNILKGVGMTKNIVVFLVVCTIATFISGVIEILLNSVALKGISGIIKERWLLKNVMLLNFISYALFSIVYNAFYIVLAFLKLNYLIEFYWIQYLLKVFFSLLVLYNYQNFIKMKKEKRVVIMVLFCFYILIVEILMMFM